MDLDSKSFDQCIDAFHARANPSFFKDNSRLVDFKTMTAAQIKDYTRDERIYLLSKKTKEQISQVELDETCAQEYAESRIWQAKNLPDMFFKTLLAPYYRLEYRSLGTDI